jgi:hypothetical protein
MGQGNKNVVDFDEAIQLMNVGVYGFTFSTGRGGKFSVELDYNNPPRLKIMAVSEEEEQS